MDVSSTLYREQQAGHQFNAGFWWALIAGSVALTGMALSEDRANLKHGAALEEANWQASASLKSPMRRAFHPRVRSPCYGRTTRIWDGVVCLSLFSCHLYNGHDGRGWWKTLPRRPTWRASSVGGSHACSIMTITTEDKYFGGTKFKDGHGPKGLAKYTEEEKALLPDIARLLADGAKLPTRNPWRRKGEELLSCITTTIWTLRMAVLHRMP